MAIARKHPASKGTTEIGFVNRNGQEVIRTTGLPGTDHRQSLYELRCQACGETYLANGTDIHSRRCPKCQGGRPGTVAAENTDASREAHWTIADAKSRLSEVIETALRGGPQVLTRNGKRTAVIVGIEEWDRRTRRAGTLADFLLASPLRGSGLDLERPREEPRDLDL